MSTPVSTIDENEARVNSKINERFKSMSNKGFKNINLVSYAHKAQYMTDLPLQTIPVSSNRRRLGGVRLLRELEPGKLKLKYSSNVMQDFMSPPNDASLYSLHSTPRASTKPINMTSVDFGLRSRRTIEKEESYIFTTSTASKAQRIRHHNGS